VLDPNLDSILKLLKETVDKIPSIDIRLAKTEVELGIIKLIVFSLIGVLATLMTGLVVQVIIRVLSTTFK
jgi:hypothetical protein